MKLSEYAQDLLVMVQLYGDHDVVVNDETHHFLGFHRSVPAPRLCVVVNRRNGDQVVVPATAAKQHNQTGENVYVV